MATAKQRAARRPGKKSATKSRKSAPISIKASAASAPVSDKDKTLDPVVNTSSTNSTAASTVRRRLPSAFVISRQAFATVWSHKKLFLGIALVYIALNIILVRGFSAGNADVNDLKQILGGNFSGGLSGLWTSLSLFTILIAANGRGDSDVGSTYQLILLLIVSLAVIWALRQKMAQQTQIRIRDTFYKGMYPLIPVILVLLVMAVQLIPFVLGGYIYGLVITNGIAVHVFEKLLWLIVLVAGISASMYLWASSIFGLYIATLPDMGPRAALKSARKLVKYRRWPIIRKLLFLPLALFVVGAIIMSPVLLYATGLAQYVFFILSTLAIIAVHAYMYTLYRELIA